MSKTYLAIGDSYTIGEAVPPEENFPNQTVAILNEKGNLFNAPQIIARTGWTTDELDAAIDEARINKTFDIVSLLIGVNNQYRGRSVSEYKTQFDHLLQRAMQFSGNKPQHVFVLSIPDWGVTPFAEGRDRNEIARSIDTFNDTAREICRHHKIDFIDITASQRIDGNKPAYLASDGLHPSGKEYKRWAEKLSTAIMKRL